MKAAYYERNGAAADVLVLGDVPTPQPGAGEVRVKLATSGVNPSDVKAREGRTRKIAFPRVIPHSDGAGVIDAVGAGVPAKRVGERVWVYNGQWKRAFGTAAEYIALPQAHAVRLPEQADFAAGANLGIPVQTAHAVVFACGPVAGKTLLIHGGAGAVAHYAIQIAKWAGAKVLTTVSSGAKAEHAHAAGADHAINYKVDDVAAAVQEFTDGQGVDHVVDSEFGENLTLDAQAVKPHGTIAIYGSQRQPEAMFPVLAVMQRCLTLRFVFVYELDAAQRAHALRDIDVLLAAGRLKHAIAARYPLDRIAEAHLAQESGHAIGNIVLDI